jgi:ATP-dependent Clp protease ATP-binding subunit ClpC
VFERFTERARHVVVLAQDEARALKHNYIGTEHILLGLLREQEGLAARVLDSLDITVALREAQALRHEYIGTEHLLLGLVRKCDGVAMRILLELGVDSEGIRDRVIEMLGGAAAAGSTGRTLVPRPRRVPRRISDYRRPSPAGWIALGWLLFCGAMGIGILIGWLIWG